MSWTATQIGTCEAATPSQRWELVDAKWVCTYKTNKDGLIAKTKATLAAKEFSHVQDVGYFQAFAPISSSASVRFLAAVTSDHGLNIFHLDVAKAFVHAKFDHDI